MGFHARSEGELESFTDDELLEYIRQARDAGRLDQFSFAMGMLAHRRRGNLFGFIRTKVGNLNDANDLTQEVMLKAMTSKFRGDHVGEFVSMLFSMAWFSIADYLEAKNKKKTEPLAEENLDDEETFGEIPDVEDFSGHADVLAVYHQVLEELNDRHRMVVELSVKGYSAIEAADEVNAVFVEEQTPMTDANVYQIFKRFKNDISPMLRPGS